MNIIFFLIGVVVVIASIFDKNAGATVFGVSMIIFQLAVWVGELWIFMDHAKKLLKK